MVVVATTLILDAAVGVGDGMAVASGDGTGVAAAAQAAPSSVSNAIGRTISLESRVLAPPLVVGSERKVLGINKRIK
jgi:hypothetical protein